MRDIRRPAGTDETGKRVETDRATIRRLASKLPLRISPRADDDGNLDFEFDGVARDTESLGGVPADEIVLDGLPPASSPAPTVFGGPGYLAVKWTAITNHDPVTYEVHVSTASGFTPDGTTLSGEVAGTSWFIRKKPDDTALLYGVPYYVKIVAKDGDGSAAPSAQDSDSLVEINSDDIAVNAILAQHILAGEITADKLEAVLIIATMIATATVGARTEQDPDGYRVYDSSGVLVVNLPSDGSDPYFAGELVAAGLTFLSVGGTDPSQMIAWLNSADPSEQFAEIEAGRSGANREVDVRCFSAAGAAEAYFLARRTGGNMSFLKVSQSDASHGRAELTVNSGSPKRLLDEAGDSHWVLATSLGSDEAPYAKALPEFSTTMPVSPTHRQVWICDNTTGGSWMFIWDATSAVWRFAGGGPTFSEVFTLQTTTSASYTDLATVGPSFLVPFTGDYLLEFGCSCRFSVAPASTRQIYMALKLGAAATADAEAMIVTGNAVVPNTAGSRSIVRSLTAGQTVKAQYKRSTDGTAEFQNRWLKATPMVVVP